MSDKKHANPHLATRLHDFSGTTVWDVFSPMARATEGCVNLGQGMPGSHPPAFLIEALDKASHDPNFLVHQYARSRGFPGLCQQVADRYTASIFNSEIEGASNEQSGKKQVDWKTEVAVHNGSSGALFNSICGLVDAGDEVIVLEPAFDLYYAQVAMFGGTVVPVPLTVQTNQETGEQFWHLDMNALEAAFTSKTKVFVLNTPHNPTGKIFDVSELHQIRDILVKFERVVVLADEVYENIYFDPNTHVSIASLPGMWDRTLTLSSAGKTFNCTGWKVGWAVGPPALVDCSAISNQWSVFSVSHTYQMAVAEGMAIALQEIHGPDKNQTYYAAFKDAYTRKRQILMDALSEAGLNPIAPQGTFFIVADTSNIHMPAEFTAQFTANETRDWLMCIYLTKVVGVAAIPPSAFYSPENQHLAKNVVRFGFCKEDTVLLQARDKFRAFFNKQ